MSQRLVDLSLPLRDGQLRVRLESQRTFRENGYATTMLHLYSHAGTHLDAPAHFVEHARTIDQIDLAKCLGPARVLDLSHKPPSSFITIEDFAPGAEALTPGARLLLRTDWDTHADQADYRADHPRLSVEAAHWLAERRLSLLGVDTPSVASLRPEHRAELITVHQILLRAEIVIVESLANLRVLRQPVIYFIALPLNIENGDGSPVRAIAVEEVS